MTRPTPSIPRTARRTDPRTAQTGQASGPAYGDVLADPVHDHGQHRRPGGQRLGRDLGDGRLDDPSRRTAGRRHRGHPPIEPTDAFTIQPPSGAVPSHRSSPCHRTFPPGLSWTRRRARSPEHHRLLRRPRLPTASRPRARTPRADCRPWRTPPCRSGSPQPPSRARARAPARARRRARVRPQPAVRLQPHADAQPHADPARPAPTPDVPRRRRSQTPTPTPSPTPSTTPARHRPACPPGSIPIITTLGPRCGDRRRACRAAGFPGTGETGHDIIR